MQHLFEFIVVKKQTIEEVAEGKPPSSLKLMYKTESSRINKVGRKIKDELVSGGIIKAEEIEEIYLRPVNITITK